MRAVIQRVKYARVEVDATIVGQIQQGLFVLLGIEQDDEQEDADWLSKKLRKCAFLGMKMGK